MIAPHFLRQELLGWVISETARAAPGELINKIEVDRSTIITSTDSKRLVFDYRFLSGPGVGGTHSWDLALKQIEDVVQTPGGRDADQIEGQPGNRLLVHAILGAGLAGLIWGTTLYWMTISWKRTVLCVAIASALSFCASLSARNALRSLASGQRSAFDGVHEDG
jgi:hypothetical protein